MEAISYAAARANLTGAMDRVCDSREPLIITRTGRPAVVMMPLEDFKAREETAYLLGSPTNAKRLLEAVEQLNARAGTDPTLGGNT